MTGKHHWELGEGANLWGPLPQEHESFVHILAGNGYLTGRTKAKTWGPSSVSAWVEHHGPHPQNDIFHSFEEFLEKRAIKESSVLFLGSAHPIHTVGTSLARVKTRVLIYLRCTYLSIFQIRK